MVAAPAVALEDEAEELARGGPEPADDGPLRRGAGVMGAPGRELRAQDVEFGCHLEEAAG